MRNRGWGDGHSSICEGPSQLTCASCVPVRLWPRETGGGLVAVFFSGRVGEVNGCDYFASSARKTWKWYEQEQNGGVRSAEWTATCSLVYRRTGSWGKHRASCGPQINRPNVCKVFVFVEEDGKCCCFYLLSSDWFSDYL